MLLDAFSAIGSAISSGLDYLSRFFDRISGAEGMFIAGLTIVLVWRFILAPIFSGAVWSGSSDKVSKRTPRRTSAERKADRSMMY